LHRLTRLQTEVVNHGFALVGHSMGGLVATYAAAHAQDSLLGALRGIVLLGVPRSGFQVVEVIRYLHDWADALAGINPFARLNTCRSVAQLTQTDRERLLEGLNGQGAQERLARIPMLSVSGGLAHLEFGSNALLNKAKNLALQALLNEQPNDGLVVESSADCARGLAASPARQHKNAYADFRRINHSHLTQNQEIADVVDEWLRCQLLGYVNEPAVYQTRPGDVVP
jgi:pimeloyl-ACP methyl ester carboxylesterase